MNLKSARLLQQAGVRHKQNLPLKCANCARAIGGFGLPLICAYCGARIVTRYECTGTAEIHHDETFCTGQLGDISTGGCFIKTLHTYAVGTNVQLVLLIAGTQLDLDARVARIIPQSGMGVAFEGLSAEQEKQISRIIGDAKSAGRLAPTNPAGTSQGASAPVPVSRNAELLAKITRRINEQGILTRQDLTDLENEQRVADDMDAAESWPVQTGSHLGFARVWYRKPGYFCEESGKAGISWKTMQKSG